MHRDNKIVYIRYFKRNSSTDTSVTEITIKIAFTIANTYMV